MWETYTIRYDEEMDNGYWAISQEEDIRIKVTKEKQNHDLARRSLANIKITIIVDFKSNRVYNVVI